MGRQHSLDRAFTDQRGSVLVGGLLLVLAMTLIGVGLFEAAVIESGQVGSTAADVRAFYAAESGLNRAALDTAYDNTYVQGSYTFDSVKGSLPNDNTTLVQLYAATCFGGSLCDSSHPKNPAYLVEAMNDTTRPNSFWLYSTGCVPGPAANPCPAGTIAAAQVRSLISRGTTTTTTTVTTTVTTTTTTHPGFSWGAFGANSLSISGGVIDSYNSRACSPAPCPYGGGNVGSAAKAGSNGSIDASGSVSIQGTLINTTNVAADPSDISLSSGTQVSGNVLSGGSVKINSTTYANSNTPPSPNPMTDVQVGGTVTHDTASDQVIMSPLPDCGPYSNMTGKITQYTNSSFTTQVASPSWKYGGVTACGTCGVPGMAGYANKPGELTFSGSIFVKLEPGTYCLGQVTANATIQVVGHTVLTVNGQFTLSGGGLANSTADPQNMQLISTFGNDAGETQMGVTLSGTSDGYMTVYAPTTGVTVSGGGSIYGAVMGKTLSLTGNSNIHYDAFLASGDADLSVGIPVVTVTEVPVVTTTTFFDLKSWQQCRLSGGSWVCS